mmetsp:Transcript_42057/g.105776  ORF Transcript_42057/g.105776 Transcript_42057/m.105776 type:complete len:213 (-) Transcript_42057:1649-2287(-)
MLAFEGEMPPHGAAWLATCSASPLLMSQCSPSAERTREELLPPSPRTSAGARLQFHDSSPSDCAHPTIYLSLSGSASMPLPHMVAMQVIDHQNCFHWSYVWVIHFLVKLLLLQLATQRLQLKHCQHRQMTRQVPSQPAQLAQTVESCRHVQPLHLVLLRSLLVWIRAALNALLISAVTPRCHQQHPAAAASASEVFAVLLAEMLAWTSPWLG